MIKVFSSFVSRLGVNPREAERFTKFLVVGTLGFIIDFGTLAFLVEIVGVPQLVAENTILSETVGLVMANTVSFTLAVLSNFTLNRYWTYPESRSKRKRVQLPQFTVVSIIGLLLNNAILAMTTPLFDLFLTNLTIINITLEAYVPAKVLATVVVLFWNFFINRYWTYSNVK